MMLDLPASAIKSNAVFFSETLLEKDECLKEKLYDIVETSVPMLLKHLAHAFY